MFWSYYNCSVCPITSYSKRTQSSDITLLHKTWTEVTEVAALVSRILIPSWFEPLRIHWTFDITSEHFKIIIISQNAFLKIFRIKLCYFAIKPIEFYLYSPNINSEIYISNGVKFLEMFTPISKQSLNYHIRLLHRDAHYSEGVILERISINIDLSPLSRK